MNDKILLVKCITLLYRESILDIKEIDSSDQVRTVLEFIKIPELSIEINSDTTVLSNLKKLTLTMCDTAGTNIYEPAELVQEIKMCCQYDEVTFEVLKTNIEDSKEEKGLKISVAALSKQVQNYYRDRKGEEILFKAYTAMKFKRQGIKSTTKFFADLCSELEPYTVSASAGDPNVIATYDLSDKSSVTKAFQKVDDFYSGKALMRTGLQGVNNMFGGGLRRGMTGVIYGLGHHFKSGKTVEWFRDFCMYNVPYMKDITKKPCNVFITFENEAESNIEMLYKLIKETETLVSIDDLPPTTQEERADYLAAQLSRTGYHPLIYRVQGGSWGYREICNLVLTLESQGYEIHTLLIDYLALASKAGCTSKMIGEDVQELFKKVRGFMSAKDILVVSPHQLNSEVKSKIGEADPDTFVKTFPGAGYSYQCKTLENELDFELFLFLVKKKVKTPKGNLSKYFLTMQRGKHRVNNPAPIEDHYTCYESFDVGRLRVDIEGPSKALTKPGGEYVQAQGKQSGVSFSNAVKHDYGNSDGAFQSDEYF